MAVASSRSSAASTRPMPSSAMATLAGSRPLVPRAPQMRRLGRPQRLGNEPFAGGQRRRRRADGLHARALDAETHQQFRQDGLWVAGMPALTPRHVTLHGLGVVAMAARGLRVEIEIAARAAPPLRRVIERSRRAAPPWRHRAGRTGRDDGSARPLALEPLRLGKQQLVAAQRRVHHAVLCASGGPLLGRDRQEGARDIPVSAELLGHELVDVVHGPAVDRERIDEHAEVAGERDGIGRRRRHEQGLVGGKPHHAAALRPAPTPGRAGPAPSGGRCRATLRRQQRFIGNSPRTALEQLRLLRLVDIAERHDAGQQHRAVANALGDQRRQRPRGAPRRHENRAFGERERVAAIGPAGHERSGEQRVGQGRAEMAPRAGSMKTFGRGQRHTLSIFSFSFVRSMRACPRAARSRPVAGRRAGRKLRLGRTGD